MKHCPACNIKLTGTESFCGGCGIAIFNKQSASAQTKKESASLLVWCNCFLLVALLGVAGTWFWLGKSLGGQTLDASSCVRFIVDGLADRTGSNNEKLQLVLRSIVKMDCSALDELNEGLKKNNYFQGTSNAAAKPADLELLNGRRDEVIYAFDNRIRELGCQWSELGERLLPPKSDQEKEWDKKLGY